MSGYAERFIKNIGTLSRDDCVLLSEKRALVAGSGGIGCYVCEHLARVGLGSLTICDCDSFELSNTNRQLYCTQTTLGQSKAITAKEKMLGINPQINATACTMRLNAQNTADILSGSNIIIDCLDNIADRVMLEKAADSLGIPLISAAVEGYMGHVAVSLTGDFTVYKLYDGMSENNNKSTLSFTAGIVGGYAAGEAVKLLLGKSAEHGKLTFIDTYSNTTRITHIK